MSKLVIKLIPAGVVQILKSPGVQADLKARAEAIAAAANNAAGINDGFTVETGIGKNRAHARVFTDTIEAVVAEATNRTLTRSFDAGR